MIHGLAFFDELSGIFFHPRILALAVLASSWVLIFKPSFKQIPLGLIPFALAVIIEYYVLPTGLFAEMVFIAPFTEEFLKFKFNLRKDLKGGIGIGAGFSMWENASYYVVFAASPVFLTLVLVRSFSDTMLHSFCSGLSSFSYQKKGFLRLGFPLAVVIHMSFNAGTLIFNQGYLQVVTFLSVVFVTMILGLIYLRFIRSVIKPKSSHEDLPTDS